MTNAPIDRNDECGDAIRTYGIASWAAVIAGTVLLASMALYFFP